MLKKKAIAILGAIVVSVSLLAGVTYAWFTSTKTDTPGVITAGKLGIDFKVTEPQGEATPLYPQLTREDEHGEYPDDSGTIPDAAEKTITLENDSDRQVLVRVSGSGMTVLGSDVDLNNNVIGEPGGVRIDNPDAVKFRYEVEPSNVKYAKINDDMYIYLPTGRAKVNVGVKVWIDGESGGNKYQGATITFDEMTAKAVQYREAAIRTEFGLGDDSVAEILNATDVKFE